MKPWHSEPRGRQLEAFVGVWGIKTNAFESADELIFIACQLFELDLGTVDTVEEAASQIEALGKKTRGDLAKKNRAKLFPEDSFAPPEDAPITISGLERMMASSKPELVDGAHMDCIGDLDIDPAALLRKVVSAVISYGQGHILYEFPEVLSFFKSRIPHRHELEGHTGVDERMFEAKAKWPNLIPGTPV